ncbi:unnamed protein product [Aphanomyces euteiches]|uniref:Uncharacterized protein n=1 Tax=Aphanomyces euteiches TaxID=100861 RepID=A0A6G0X4E7_9STRA|nr:hypothetical protein Ae201684_008504 [Aphanomyces euteiches]KAH9085460.1 hypothetical protein Ae201684P_005168 [Aphanomyces euteiches]KAH9143632.1 hypothetical protein AeRB84_012425 [Aphanomyces euteiches]
MSKKLRDETFGLKRSSGVDYAQVKDRVIDDERFERQRALRSGQVEPVLPKENGKSATMDAFVRMVTGQEEKLTMAEKLAGPSNRPTWEEFKKESSGKLELSAAQQEQAMLEYRRQLDIEREKVLKKRNKKEKKLKKHRSSSSDDSDDDDSRRKHKKKHKKHKKHHKSSSPVRLSSFFKDNDD